MESKVFKKAEETNLISEDDIFPDRETWSIFFSSKWHIMLLTVLRTFGNYAEIMLVSLNYASCHQNYAT